MSSEHSRVSLITKLGLLATSFCVFGLFGRGELSSVDEVLVHRTTMSLALRGSLVIDWADGEDIGRRTSRYSVAPSLWGVPFFAIAETVIGDRPNRDQWLIYFTQLGSAAATSLTVLLLVGWLSSLGYSQATSIACGLLYAFGTLAFPYASTSFVQVIATPALLWCCQAISEGRRWRSMFAFALVVWCRPDLLVLLPALCLAIWQDESRESRVESPELRVQNSGSGLWTLNSGLSGRIGLVTVGGVVGLFVNVFFNWLRGDDLFMGDYSSEAFTTPLWIGLFGLLVSSGKGLAWHSPLAAAGLLAALAYAGRRPLPGRLVLYVIGTHVLVVAKWWTWHGGLSWGPRLLLPILPLCLLPVAEWLSRWDRHSILSRRAFVTLAGLSVLVNAWAASQPRLGFWNAISGLPIHETESVFIPQTGPFGVGWQAPVPFLWQTPGSTLATVLVSAFLIGGLLGLIGLFRVARLSRACETRHDDVDGVFHTPYCTFLIIGVLLVIGNLPWLVDAIGDLFARGDRTQYRQMEKTGTDAYRGLLVIPIRGTYTFYSDFRSERGIVRIFIPRSAFRVPRSEAGDWHELFSDSRVAQVSLEVGEYPIVVRGWARHPSTLWWTIPGAGLYKQVVPCDYLISAHPTFWQSLRIFLRHYVWIVWVLAFLALGSLRMKDDE